MKLNTPDNDTAFLKSGIETRNPGYNAMVEKIKMVCTRSEEPFLIKGQNGSGKSTLARRIYELKKIKGIISGEFIQVNCAELKEGEALDFLYGMITGKDEIQAGLLFINDVDKLCPEEQAKLLYALEGKSSHHMGSNLESGFHLICGTEIDLQAEARQGHFREDLLSRIGLWTFNLPELMRRPEDIDPNLDHELEIFSKKSGLQISFKPDARRLFLNFATSPQALWPANFRDFQSSVSRMCTMAEDEMITLEVVAGEIGNLTGMWHPEHDVTTESIVIQVMGKDRDDLLDRFERIQLEDVLNVLKETGSLPKAGRILFSESRKYKKSANDSDRLRKYLAKYDLTWQGIKLKF